jgi:two-component system, chemotaxis family, protein-glutamate methylesterase/glutaminase
MTTRAFRVLVVEDFTAFRQFISSILARRRNLQIVGEASDGLEAVQKAVVLKPDLITMDISLPTLRMIPCALFFGSQKEGSS